MSIEAIHAFRARLRAMSDDEVTASYAAARADGNIEHADAADDEMEERGLAFDT